jgi:tetratricopeptide (TPR) repeat protein
MNAGLTGDAYAQLGDFAKAAQAYEKAILAGNDQLTTPYYGLKAGAAFEQTGNFARALEIYTMIQNNYPGATEITEVLKAIARVEQKL